MKCHAEGMIRGKLPPDCNPQRRHVRREEHFCGAVPALREHKMLSLQICRPGVSKTREANLSGGGIGGGRIPPPTRFTHSCVSRGLWQFPFAAERQYHLTNPPVRTYNACQPAESRTAVRERGKRVFPPSQAPSPDAGIYAAGSRVKAGQQVPQGGFIYG